jgi:hypothetical protein
MPEWLHDTFGKDENLDLSLVAIRLSAAFVLGCVIGGIYRLTHGRGRAESGGMLATIVLLTVLIGMVTLVIGNSVARAFSLVGALAIVRFRTVVEDTRDTAFVIFAVSVGMAAGAGFLKIPLVGIPIAALAAFLFRPRDAVSLCGSLDFALTVRIGAGYAPETLLRESFQKHLERSRLTATVTVRQGAAFDLAYAVRLRHQDSAIALVTELNGLTGVQNVELRPA